MSTARPADDQAKETISAAIGRIPSGLFILTARHEDRTAGMLASWVQQVCFEPPMVVVAIAKGRAIMPLISESRRFGLCQVARDDRLLVRKFSVSTPEGEDPFLGMDLIEQSPGGVPIPAQSLAYLECTVACHMDVEGDHDLFVGRIQRGAYLGGDPEIRTRLDGFKY